MSQEITTSHWNLVSDYELSQFIYFFATACATQFHQ